MYPVEKAKRFILGRRERGRVSTCLSDSTPPVQEKETEVSSIKVHKGDFPGRLSQRRREPLVR